MLELWVLHVLPLFYGCWQREAATFVPCFRERERERALIGIFHSGGSRAPPAHGLRITFTEKCDSVREEEEEEEEEGRRWRRISSYSILL
jgi:hypothetical protein